MIRTCSPWRARAKQSLVCGGLLAWAAAAAAGTIGLGRYAATPGPAAAPPLTAPDEAGGTDYRLICFLHPRCPCSRATLTEADRLLVAGDGRLGVEFVFVTDGLGEAFARSSDLWRRAERIGGREPRIDRDGALAAAYGAGTSGHCVVYGPGGELVYAGGITPARGHEGDSAGRAAILKAVRGASGADRARGVGPVFGCPLGSCPSGGRSAGDEL